MAALPVLSGLQIKEYGENAFIECAQVGVYKLADRLLYEKFYLKLRLVISELQDNCDSISDTMIDELQDGFFVGVDVDTRSFITLEAIRKSHIDRFGNDDPDFCVDVCKSFRTCLENMRHFGHVKVDDVLF
jgi:hypothetical protein